MPDKHNSSNSNNINNKQMVLIDPTQVAINVLRVDYKTCITNLVNNLYQARDIIQVTLGVIIVRFLII